MPPYETKCLQRIFDTTGLSDTKLVDMIKVWLSEVIEDTHFNDYDYTIIVGDELFHLCVSQIFDNPMLTLSHILDRSRIKMRFCDDPLRRSMIKIEWRAPVHRDYVFSIGDIYINHDKVATFDAYKNINRLPQIKKVIYNDPATIIFWADDTKTVVQCQPEDEYDPEKGLALAIAKKALGNTSRKLNDVLHKWEPHACKNCKHKSEWIKSKDSCCGRCLMNGNYPNWEKEVK